MPLMRKLFQRRSLTSKSLPPLTGRTTAAAVTVTPERALQVAAVFSAVRLLAETGSMLPVGIYQRSGSSRIPMEDHPAALLLTHKANPQLPAGEFWAQMLGWMLMRGNAAAYVERGGGGQPVGLWPIAWTNVEPRRVPETGELVYKVTPDEEQWAPIREDGGLVRAENLLHFRAFGIGGIEGLSPIGMARQAVGTGWAATSYIGSFFARDASPGGIVSVPGKLTDGQYERLTRQWNDLHEGFDKSHRLAVMEGGARWEKTTLSPADASFLEVYKLTRSEIAGIFGVPPHMIGDVDRSTSWGSGIEQQSLGYVIYSLMPWLTRLERTAHQLLADPSLYLKFNSSGLLRGDTAQRYGAYAQARQWGWMSVNDIRAKEDEPPIEGGDEYVVPLNMTPAGQAAPPEQRTRPALRAAAPEPLAPVDVGFTELALAVGGDRTAFALSGIRSRPHAPLRRAEETVEAPAAEDLPAWITRHYEVIAEFFAAQGDRVLEALNLRPDTPSSDLIDRVADDEVLTELLLRLAQGLVAQVGGATAAALGGSFAVQETTAVLASGAAATAANINSTTVDKLVHQFTVSNAPKDVLAMFDRMTQARAEQLAKARVNYLANFGSHEGAKQAGAASKTWRVWDANPRPTHARADGQTVGMREAFTIGSRRGRWPHDHRLGVDEIAGCTCRLQFNRRDPRDENA
ncbi:phage portal protein [Streptomyces sp. NRRL F-5135]|uniref:phage portal protein n=1 Tax=Streptomyces sp. NRRL F-5135 TaxID=1463858 RepID=UPI000689927A|nr:phage portal protein [Streptomyces sp. NRRL F-5135]